MQTQLQLKNICLERDNKHLSPTKKKVNVVCYREDKEKNLQVLSN